MTAPRFRTGCLAAALLFAGCQPGPSTPETPRASAESSASAASAAPASAPAATSASRTQGTALMKLTRDEGGPVIEHADGPPNSVYALPAAAARARDGSYVVLIVWFPVENGTPVIALATSTDARTWTLDNDPILTDLGVGGTDPGPIPTALLQLDDGSWQLFGWADDPTRSPHFTSWRASAPDLHGPWRLDGAHVLDTGEHGSWDSQTAGIRSVVRGADGYAAWYEGSPPGSSLRGYLGYATSVDGMTWQKYDDPATTSTQFAASDPVVRTGICGMGTSLALFQPHVERDSAGYSMVFGAFGRSREQMDLFGAVSVDGAHWTCGTPDALLRTSGIPGSQGTHTFAAFPLGDGRIGLLIEALGEGHSDIWFAAAEAAG